MIDLELLDHLEKHGMEIEVKQYLASLANREPRRAYQTDHTAIAAQDYVIGCALDPGVSTDAFPLMSRGDLPQPIPELTVFYKSGARRIFVGAQCTALCPALVEYCKWLDEVMAFPDVPWKEPPALPPSLRS